MAARPRTAAARSRGKDPTKVDRSAAYAARYLAKNIVAAGLAQRCTIQLAYAIGVSRAAVALCRHARHRHGRRRRRSRRRSAGSSKLGGLTPRGIRTHLGLNKPIYAATAAYGHFGRKAEGDLFPWEKTDLVDDLKAALGLDASLVQRPRIRAGRDMAEQQVAAVEHRQPARAAAIDPAVRAAPESADARATTSAHLRPRQRRRHRPT